MPASIFVAYRPIEVPVPVANSELSESITGSALLREMGSLFLGGTDLKILTKKYEKPEAWFEGEEVSVSFSHTRSALSAALSMDYNVGCDMEEAARAVHPRLTERMKHSEEDQGLYSNSPPIRIWTLKEAALKQIGTGLRKPMNYVLLDQTDDFRFRVIFDDGKRAKICSFPYQEYWISICYQKTP